MTNTTEQRYDINHGSIIPPEGIYRGMLKSVGTFDLSFDTGCSAKAVQLVFELTSNGEQAVEHVVSKNYILSLEPGSCINAEISQWRGFDIAPEEQSKGIAFLETLVGWPVDIEITHIGQVKQPVTPFIRRIDQAGKLFKEKRRVRAMSEADAMSSGLADIYPCIMDMLNMMQACVITIKNNLDRETTLPVVRENVEKLENTLANGWLPKMRFDGMASTAENN